MSVSEISLDMNGYPSKTNRESLSMDPPLVAATRVDDEHSVPAMAHVIQAVAISSDPGETMHHVLSAAAAPEQEGLDQTVASSATTHLSSLSSGASGLQTQHPDATRIEAVQIDELPSSREQSRELHQAGVPKEGDDKDTHFCWPSWKVTLVVLACLVIGATIGLVLTFSNQNAKSNGALSVNPTLLRPTSAPSRTISPSFSPTCVSTWEASLETPLQGMDYEHFYVAPDGLTAILTFTQTRYTGDEAFFLTTLDFTDNSILESTVRNEKLQIQGAAMNMHGSRIVMGVSEDLFEKQELGGALWVYQRIQHRIWLPLHYQFAGGGSQGAVFAVATNDAGTLYAIVSGSFANNIPTQVQVYSALNADAALLTPVGERLVENAFSPTTLVGLSGNGQRLVVYTENGVIRVLDYDGVTWQPDARSLSIPSDSHVNVLKVSGDGNTFALLSSKPFSDSFIFRRNRHEWVTMRALGIQASNPYTSQFGSFSENGATLVMATSGYSNGAPSKVHVYQQQDTEWSIVETLELPAGGGQLLGVSVDSGGDRLVVATKQLLQVYDRICTNVPTPSPRPSTLSTLPSSSDSVAVSGTLIPTLAGSFQPPFHGDSHPNGKNSALPTGSPAISFPISPPMSSPVFPPVSPPVSPPISFPISFPSSPGFGGGDQSNAPFGVAAKPGSGSSLCVIVFKPELLYNLTTRFTNTSIGTSDNIFAAASSSSAGFNSSSAIGITSEGNASSDTVGSENWFPSSGKYLSSDGSTLVVTKNATDSAQFIIDTYDLANSSAKPGQFLVSEILQSVAVSAKGERLVFGSNGLGPVPVNQPRASIFVYNRDGIDWTFDIEVEVGAGENGGVVSIDIDEGGRDMAYAVGGGNETSFVSAYTLDKNGTSVVTLGNTLRNIWLDDQTKVRLVDKRLFVYSSDGFIRAYDLINDTWTQIGQEVSHFYDAMFIPSGNNTIVATASEYYGISVYELDGTYWIPVDVQADSYTTIAGQPADRSLVTFSFSSDGQEILLTEMVIESDSVSRYESQLLERVGDQYQLSYPTGLKFDNLVQDAGGNVTMAQLTGSGDVVVVTDTQVFRYGRNSSCLPSANGV